MSRLSLWLHNESTRFVSDFAGANRAEAQLDGLWHRQTLAAATASAFMVEAEARISQVIEAAVTVAPQASEHSPDESDGP